MRKAVQKRSLETRSRLICAAEEIVLQHGHEPLRVEEVVLRAGVAKGTFFVHFKDKDELLDLLIGAQMHLILDRMVSRVPPQTVDELVTRLIPMVQLLGSERCVFDVVLRRSGSAALSDIGPIASALGRLQSTVSEWLKVGQYRQDTPAELLAEGVEAFMLQVPALNFCALSPRKSMKARLQAYLRAWLVVPT
ncbi:MAG: TetR/AcrR family transcriptional regulator [Hydrogenophaga sp.]|uniref:TetR/AcrR family transcriptional regulator n=1 Tax=Hydrogenophaga sp. TaxID=1904254 RepID=UPI002ABB80DF|nr:TetR/AcrR family transcriptional regulator [Hydrogenophaga sp.]MDZ4187288.1 TetR/AcrR family transcriptional regulator [Hydrogenophaga sp.]